MSVYVDVICSACELRLDDQWSDMIGMPHKGCTGEWVRLWTMTRGLDPGTHSSERVVVYESEREGRVQYPGRNDAPVPERLRHRGYVRRELNVSELASFERKHHVMNERRHFDRNGRYD